MKIFLERMDDAFYFKATNERNNSVLLDSTSEHGGHNKGASPMELLLMAIAGCSGIDIISILKKQKQTVTSFKAEVDGEREKNKIPALYKHIAVIFHVEGHIPVENVKKAVRLSMEKYCSVAKILEKSAAITYRIKLNGTEL